MPGKRRVLLIDSSDSARSILFKEISDKAPELDVIACANGREALTAARRFEFEVITTGTSLADTDGYQLIDEIRQTPKNRDSAIFVFSGDDNKHNIEPGVEENGAVTAYFNKSEGHQALVNFILSYIGSQNDLPVKILYIDKSATSTAITTAILERNDVDYHHFSDADEAVDFLRQDLLTNSDCSVDVMITNLMLSSGMTGFELIQKIRNDLELDYLTLPILLMTMEPGEDERTDFTGIFGAGTNDFITKPVKEEDLLSRLQNLVNIKRQSKALNP
ncbi:MAG: response regulator [Halieaceae bacterium]|nr:response regulator [Halieaceae bacterium]